MSSTTEAAPRAPLSDAYRAVWRWHFYAGVFVMPFLMLLALTGGLYLFKAEIDRVAYRPMIQVAASARTTAPDAWVQAAERAGQGRAAEVLIPARADEAVRLRVDAQDGVSRTVFVDPHTARVTGVVAQGGVTETIKTLHSLELFGPAMNILVEVVAGWAIILCATGLYLWWPRSQGVAILVPRAARPDRRPFWRDLHAVTGIWVGGTILFLAVTGMPWSAVWGDRVLNIMRESGLGRPTGPSSGPWLHADRHETPAAVGWTMEHAALAVPTGGPPSLSRVVAAAEAQALPRPYVVSMPRSPDRAWIAARATRKAEEARSLYVDPRTGEVRADIRWSQFGAGAKAFEWGIAVHQGLQYGELNRIVMLLGCIGVWVLAITGLVMWWKRRPPDVRNARMGAPPAPPGSRARFAVLGIVLPLGILYPLTGLSLLAALLIDLAVRRLIRARPQLS